MTWNFSLNKLTTEGDMANLKKIILWLKYKDCKTCENHDQLQHDTYDIHKHQLFREREKQPEVNQQNGDQKINAFLYRN